MKLSNLSTSAKIGIGWAFCIVGGLYAFYLSKQQIDRTRYESMQVRDRLRRVTLIEKSQSSDSKQAERGEERKSA